MPTFGNRVNTVATRKALQVTRRTRSGRDDVGEDERLGSDLRPNEYKVTLF